MATQTTTFSAVGVGNVFGVNHGDAIYYSVTPGVTLDATFKLQRTRDLGTWETVVTTSAAVGDTIFYTEHPGLSSMLYRWICTAFGETSDPVDTLIYDTGGLVMASFVGGNVTFAEDGTITSAGSIDAAGSVSTQDLSVGDDASIVGVLEVGGATTLSGTFTVGVNGTGKDVKFFGDTSGKYWLWDESADTMIVNGLTELRAGTAITGNTTFGVDDTGVDVTFYGDTTGKYAQWDASADQFIVNGDLKMHGVTSGPITILRKDGSGNALEIRCAIADIPVAAGYAKGCLLFTTDGSDHTNTLYCNIGNATTADFNAVTIAA